MKKIISGYASVFNVVDLQGDLVLDGAFGKAVIFKKLPLLWQHNPNRNVGEVFQIYQDNYGLFVKASINTLHTENAKLVKQIEMGLYSFSIGYNTSQSYIDNETGVRYLEGIDVLEISIVTMPANQNANIISIRESLE